MLRLYTQPNCGFCDVLKARLQSWGMKFTVYDISENQNAKQFLKTEGHTTVPQLYIGDFNINKNIDTYEFTEEMFYDRLDVFIAETPYDNLEAFIEENDK